MKINSRRCGKTYSNHVYLLKHLRSKGVDEKLLLSIDRELRIRLGMEKRDE